jgi:hypothetical protein
MRRAIGSPTKAQQAYHDAARALGCVICLFRIRHGMQQRIVCGHVHIHHRNLHDLHGAPQLGHDSVVALGGWHHDGVLLERFPSTMRMREVFGPSFQANARDFRAWTEDVLPQYAGRGTQRWQAFQDDELRRRGHGIAA